MTNERYKRLKFLLWAYDSFLQCIVTVVSVHNSLQ